jgi:hypothetical protein
LARFRFPVLRALLLLALAPPALAEEAPEAEASMAPPEQLTGLGAHGHVIGAIAVGRGLRFNNPYRLATPLGDSAESLSLSATYLDLAIGAAFGAAAGPSHGGHLHLSVALDGIPQEVIAPSYLLAYRFGGGLVAYGRAGVPIVLEPDLTAGFELGAGGAWLFNSGIGATAELSGALYYGAATHETSATVIPLVALQLGVLVDWELLP